MEVCFSFGRCGISIALPPGPKYELVEARTASALENVQDELESALDNPIGSDPLSRVAINRNSAAISVCDITRPAPNSLTLPPLLRRLHDAGIQRDGITILIATGLHRGATPGEIRQILGSEIAAKYRVVNHDARAVADHRWLGRTGRGTPVLIDERFISADLHITLGFIEQHLMLGFSGGQEVGGARLGSRRDNQGHPFASLHARADGDRGIDYTQPAA